MKYNAKLKFATICRNKPIGKPIIAVFNGAFRLNNRYFHKRPKNVSIFVVDSEEEYKKYASNYYSKWSTGVCLGTEGMAIKSPDFIQKTGRWKKTRL